MKKIPFIFMLAALLFQASPARAFGSLRELQPLTFGQLAITGTPPVRVIITPDGGETTPDGGITLLHPRGQPGMYELTGYTATTNIAITVNSTSDDGMAGNGSFTLNNFLFSVNGHPGEACTMSSPCITDGSGQLIINVGATLTAQAGQTYGPGPYRGTYDLVLNINF